MEKFTASGNYKEATEAAKAVGIDTKGVKRPQLADLLNAKMDELGVEEFAKIVEAHNAKSTDSGAEVSAEEGEKVARVKAAKWHEEQGFAYNENDVIEITGGKVLVGRFAVVNKPSAKREAVKAFLLHEKTGEFQRTNITVDYTNCKKVDLTVDEVKAGIKEAVEAKEAERKAKQEEIAAKKVAAKAEKEKPAATADTQQTA